MTGRAVTGVLALGIAAVALLASRTGSPFAGPTAVAERGAYVDALPVRGEIRPVRSVVLSAPSSGGDLQIVEIVANGTSVAAGDVVVAFDPTSHLRTLEQKESEVKQALSELEKARAEERRRVQAAEAALEKARSIAARQRLDLVSADLTSKVEAGKREIAVANADRFVAENVEALAAERDAGAAGVVIAQQKADKVRSDVDDTRRIIASLTLSAPAAGMVSLLPNLRAGGPMSRNAPEFRRGDRAWFGAAIAELPDLRSVRMTLRVDEADRARLRAGGAARIRVDAVPDRELDGRIEEISLVATPDFTSFPPVRNFDVAVTLLETDARLRTGMSATARLELDRLDDVLLVPAAAVFARSGTSIVFAVTGASLTETPVTVMKRGRDQVALTGGIDAGTRVALQAPDGWEGRR